MSYESTIPFRSGYDGLAVYCSDGRFSAPSDEFLHAGLKLTRCDRVVVPGGPRRLLEEADGALEDVVFLIEAHAVKRVVLIAHADCGYYALRLGLDAEAMPPQQEADLRAAAAALQARLPEVQVEAYRARHTDGDRVQFEAVALQ